MKIIVAIFGALFLGVAMLVVSADSAAAGACGRTNCWGAVGMGNASGVHYKAWSAGAGTRKQAKKSTRSACGGNCNTVKAFKNSCGALAKGKGRKGFGTGLSRSAAKSAALAVCTAKGGGCRIRVVHCSK